MIIGFIGCGNMAQAMIGGIVKSKRIPSNQIIASAKHEENLNMVKNKYHVNITLDNLEVAKTADVLFLAVKPNQYQLVIEEIKDGVKENVIIVNIAAGISSNKVETLFNKNIKVIKAMPNTPALVLEGMSAIWPNDLVTHDELETIKSLFKSFGRVEVVNEKLFDIVTGVSGSAPAYIFMLIESMADAAVLHGMSRNLAYTFASQTVLGSAKMVLETGMHPGALKDMVTSPGGTTIEAVAKLEEKGFRSAMIEAITACTNKSKSMTK